MGFDAGGPLGGQLGRSHVNGGDSSHIVRVRRWGSALVGAGIKSQGKAVVKASKAAATCGLKENSVKLASIATAAAIVIGAPMLIAPEEAFARDVQPYAGLTPCKSNAAFKKREKNELKTLEKRLKKYDAESAPALALNATMQKTRNRFANYGEAGLLCGADGLPHLIVDGNLEHLGEFALPGLGFLYVAGWIGYAGRSYVQLNKETAKKPTEGEIIINVPMALKLMFAAGAWPIKAAFELKNGTLTAPASEITVSPR
uniref:Photosystem I reaction center subunit III n=1 Tax=Mantoniella antarctica TaxID=81844 RepID=A0A7S0T2K2_9CHLO